GKNMNELPTFGPYGAVGSGVPYTSRKNISHASALTAGTVRKAVAFANGLVTLASRTSTRPPSVAASTANRVCIHGSAASPAPCHSHGIHDRRAGSTSAGSPGAWIEYTAPLRPGRTESGCRSPAKYAR